MNQPALFVHTRKRFFTRWRPNRPVKDTRLRGLHFVAFLAVCSGCSASATPAFDSRFPDNDPVRNSAISAKLALLEKSEAPLTPLKYPFIAAITDTKEPELIVYDLNRRSVRWRRPVPAQSRPEILGDLALTVVQRKLVAYGVADGKPRWEMPLEEELLYLGAAKAGTTVVYSAASAHFGVKQGSSSVTAVDAASGKVLWERRSAGRLGAPAALGEWVFIPWDWQSLAVLNIADGAERARLRSTDDLISWVKADSTGVSFGHDAIYRFTDRGYSGTRQSAALLASPLIKAPVVPPLRENAYEPKLASRSAKGRIQLFFELGANPKGQLAVVDARFYLGFYRYLFAFNDNGKLVWCSVLDRDLINGQAVKGGLVTVEESGMVKVFDANTGSVRLQTALPVALASAAIDARTITLAPLAQTEKANVIPSLRAGLAEIIADPDNRLVQARIFAVQQLAGSADPETTRDLLDLYDNDRLPEVMRKAVADGLRSRKIGSEYLIEALSQHYDFLDGTRPPRLSVIATALGKMGARRAVGPLFSHLFDPNTPLQDLAPIVSAIAALGNSASIGQLRDFLLTYRADSSFQGAPQALNQAAESVFLRGQESDRVLLAKLAQDPRTFSSLAATIDRLVQQPKPKKVIAMASAHGNPSILPKRLDPGQVDAIFNTHLDALRPCIVAEVNHNPKTSQVRVAFIVKRDGTAYGIKSLPDNPALAQCLMSNIAAWRFPGFSEQRQMVSYILPIPSDPTDKTGIAPDGAGDESISVKTWRTVARPWWSWYAAQDNPYYRPAPAQKPWWMASSSQPADSSETPWWLPAVKNKKGDTALSRKILTSPPAETKKGPQPPAKPSAQPTRSSDSSTPPVADTPSEVPWWLPATKK